MKKTLAALLIGALALPLAAAPYRALNPDSLFSGNPKKPPISVNLNGVETAIRNLSAVAGDYPPRFDNENDRRRAIADLGPLGVVLDSMVENTAPKGGAKASAAYLASLAMRARFHWIGHNLDQPGHAAKADADYRRRIELAAAPQEKAFYQELHGRFLSSTGQLPRAISQLEALRKAGRKEAAMPLGMAYLMSGQKAKSLPLLREHVRNFPQDKQAKELLSAVENGRVEMKTVK